MKGRRRLENEWFVAFRSHYLFQSWFIHPKRDPRSPREGGVEGEVGRFRRNHLVLGADTFESYLAELEVVQASAGRIVLRVGPTLAQQAFRRCGSALAAVCHSLFGSRRVLLAGDGAWVDRCSRSRSSPGRPSGGPTSAQRADKRPQLSDLRDSGAVEQDANTVLVLYRPDRYEQNAKPGLIEVIVAKARNAECSTIELEFEGSYQRFRPTA